MAALAVLSGCARSAGGPPPPVHDYMAEMQQQKAAFKQLEVDCPWPDAGPYAHAAQVFDRGRPMGGLSPNIRKLWVNGCATVAFSVNEDGAVTHATITSANPGAAGPAALAVVQQTTYARGDTPEARFMVRIGFANGPNGGSSMTQMPR